MAFSFEAALGKTDIFATVNPTHLSKFAEIVSPQTYIEGQVVTHQGDLGTGLYIMTKGKVDVIANQGESNEVKIATLGEGDMFGDMALLLEQPRS
ncbi:MAG: cyclic nucleotide-binding domain-containing protein, partial [Chloroflexi bacterium]|nr:cyclic nucleotide-binding domain-containing protein [Chloroflexota bacterium]